MKREPLYIAPYDALIKNGFGLRTASNNITAYAKRLDLAWQEFIAQPVKVKQRHTFIEGKGYEYRGPEELDYKETFHVTSDYKLHLHATDADKKYVRVAQGFIEEVEFFVRALSVGISLGGHGFDFAQLILKPPSTHLLRSIHYFPRTADQVMKEKIIAAASHLDKGLTIHWYQSDDGLQILWEGKWCTIVHPEDAVLFYMGLLGQLYSKCIFTAVCHRAVATHKTEVIGRRVHVSFIDFGTMRYDKGTYGPTQERFPAGENYNLSPQEFEKYFIPAEKALVY